MTPRNRAWRTDRVSVRSPATAQATVSWTAPTSNGGSAITGYTVTSSPGGVTATTAGATTSAVSGPDERHRLHLHRHRDERASAPARRPPHRRRDPGPSTDRTWRADRCERGPWQRAGHRVVDRAAPTAAARSPATPSPRRRAVSPRPPPAPRRRDRADQRHRLHVHRRLPTNSVGTGPASAPSTPVTPLSGSVKSNSAEGGTSGTSVTAANSGGASGTAFTVFNKGSGAHVQLDGCRRARSVGVLDDRRVGHRDDVGWNGYSATSMALRFYYNPGPTLPSTVIRLADIRNASGTAARIELSAANQIFIQNNAGTTVTTFAHALQANTWYRIELAISVSSSAATINAAYYLLDSTTPVDPTLRDDDRQHRRREHHPGDGRLNGQRDLDGDQLLRRRRDPVAVDRRSSARSPRARRRLVHRPQCRQLRVTGKRLCRGPRRLNGGSAITGYTVTTSPGGATTPASGTSVLVTGLTNGTRVHVHRDRDEQCRHRPGVSAFDAGDACGAATAPGAPTAVTAVAGDGQATVSWTAPSNGGSPITGYTVTTSPGGATTPASGTSVLVTGLTNGTAVHVHRDRDQQCRHRRRVDAFDAGDAALRRRRLVRRPACRRSCRVTGKRPCRGPHRPTAAARSPSYTVTSSPGAIVVNTGGTSVAVTGLTDGTAVHVHRDGTNSVGTGPASAPSSPVTPAAAPTVPGAPTAVSGTPGNTEAIVSWTAPANDGGSAITGYTVTASPGGAIATTAGATSAAVTNLSNGISYTFTVTATNSVGTGAPSDPSASVIPDPTVPDAPTGANAVAGDGQATVSWTDPDNGGSAITGYTVTTFPGGATTPASDTPVLVTGLTDGTSYTFTVIATNGVGTSAASAPSSPVTPTGAADRARAPTGVRRSRGRRAGDGEVDSTGIQRQSDHRLHGDDVTWWCHDAGSQRHHGPRHRAHRWHAVHVHRHRDERCRHESGVRAVFAGDSRRVGDRAWCADRCHRRPWQHAGHRELDSTRVQRRQCDHRLHGDRIARGCDGDNCRCNVGSGYHAHQRHDLHLHRDRQQQRRDRPGIGAVQRRDSDGWHVRQEHG